MKTKKPRKKKAYNLKTRLVGKIRQVWRWHPHKDEVKKRCKTADGWYRCEKCRRLCEEIDVDHKNPAVDPTLGWQGYDVFIERLFCDVSNLWGLCTGENGCHEKKTKKENNVRKKARTKKSP